MKIKIDYFKNKFILRVDEDNSGIISYRGNILNLNETAVEYLLALNETKSIEKTKYIISKDYNVSENEIISDIMDIINTLKVFGIDYVD